MTTKLAELVSKLTSEAGGYKLAVQKLQAVEAKIAKAKKDAEESREALFQTNSVAAYLANSAKEIDGDQLLQLVAVLPTDKAHSKILEDFSVLQASSGLDDELNALREDVFNRRRNLEAVGREIREISTKMG